MSDLKRLLLGGNQVREFSDSFDGANFTPSQNGVLYSNVYNNWSFISGNSFNPAYNHLTGNIYGSSASGSNNYYVSCYRNLENYNINRSGDFTFAFYRTSTGGQTAAGTNMVSFSIGGIAPTSNFAALGGLEFRITWGINQNGTLEVLNNGVSLGSFYIGGIPNNAIRYLHISKRGNAVYFKIDTSAGTPSSYDAGVTMNNNTASSNAVILYTSGQGFQDYGVTSIIDSFYSKMY